MMIKGSWRQRYRKGFIVQAALHVSLVLLIIWLCIGDDIYGEKNDEVDISPAVESWETLDKLMASDIISKSEEKDLLLYAVEGTGVKDEVVEALIKGGSELDITDEDGYTPIMLAAQYGHYYMVEMLIDSDAELNVVSDNKEDVMSCAVNSVYSRFGGLENYKIIRLLYDHGISLNADELEKPFEELGFSQIGVIRCIKLLYEDESNGKISITDGGSILDSIYKGDSENIINYLKRHKEPDFYILASCVANDNIEALEFYHKNGGDINITGENIELDENLLMTAAAFDSVRCAEYLIKNSADNFTYSEDDPEHSLSAEMYAEKYGSDNVLKILKDGNIHKSDDR